MFNIIQQNYVEGTFRNNYISYERQNRSITIWQPKWFINTALSYKYDLQKILEDTDKGVNAVLATFVDWKDAFPNQCHKLGIEAFIECGVRPSVIPVLINYFQDQSVIVKWHNKQSQERHVP